MEIIKLEDLKKTFKRLKNNTKNFSLLIVRDPLDYVDYIENLDNNLRNLIYSVNNYIYQPQKPIILESPKSKGINRATIVYYINDMLIYRYCIEQIEEELLKRVKNKNIRGGIKIKAIQNSSDETYYEKWFNDWLEYNNSIKESLKRNNYAVSTDIASYFDNINLVTLKNLVTSEVTPEKRDIVNLLFYFLEISKLRNKYEPNTSVGLPQEDIDCSRLLAYFYLYPHDIEMQNLCKHQNNFEYYRYVDDMTFIVPKEIDGRIALKEITNSLRKLGLMSSIEKTLICGSQTLKKELFIKENDKLSKFEEKIKQELKKNNEVSNKIISQLVWYYKKLSVERYKDKNWIKVLKRFYTLFSYCKENIPLKELKNHLIYFPSLFMGNKFVKYLIRIKNKKRTFNNAIKIIIEYLYSKENLYPALEANLIETILYFDSQDFYPSTLKKIKKLSEDIFFKKNNYKPLSEYARSLATLLIFKFFKDNVNKLAVFYIKNNVNDTLLKKYLVIVSMTSTDQILRNEVFNKAKSEGDVSLSNFIDFILLIKNRKRYLTNKFINKNYDEIYIINDTKNKLTIKEKYYSVRHLLLKELINIYSIKSTN